MNFAGVQRNFEEVKRDLIGVPWLLSDIVEQTAFFVEFNILIGLTVGKMMADELEKPQML